MRRTNLPTRPCRKTYGRHKELKRTRLIHRPCGDIAPPVGEVSLVRATKTRRAVQVADLSATRAYLDRDPLYVAAVDIAGIRTLVSVPMLKENEVVGAIVIYRQGGAAVHREADRAGDRTSPLKPSSPSRTRGC